MKRVIRVFPSRTNATPCDEWARVNAMPGWFDGADAVEISVAFTWDLPRAEELAREWRHVVPVTMGGPALMTRGEEFTPGRYVGAGYTITSRGCPNRCWFCSVWKREGGTVRELPIHDGFDVLDDNLLACSEPHIRAVFAMLSRRPQKPKFTGGLEAKILKPWHCVELRKLRPERLYFAYDTPDDLEPLRAAGVMLRDAGFTTASHTLSAYVLCGWPADVIDDPAARMHTVRAKDGGTIVVTVNKGKAIALKCTECMGWETHPNDCTSPLCPLYPFRKRTLAAYGAKGKQTA